MLNEDLLYWIWLADKCGPASKEFSRLISRFENPFEIYRLEEEEIGAIDFVGERLKNALCKKSLEGAYSILKYCKEKGVDVISYADPRYPSRLKTLEDPPALLYVLGKLPDLNRRLCIGVVGTRKITAYGMSISYKISYELASANVCIVSGMALGIDAVSACAALEANGSTVAVLGCGIDRVYPRTHTKLHRCIAHNGAVITEYPPFEEPYGSNFPKRNRIISGISQGVLIVEGDMDSGSMITAKRAIEQGREVFAIPGKVGEITAEGPNALIRSGVTVALSSEDILNHYDFIYHDVINYRGLKHSKDHSAFQARYVERYGVSSREYFGASSKSEVKEKTVEKEQIRLAKEETASKSEQSKAPERAPDNSEQMLATLDETSRKVFELMPIDRAISIDEFVANGIGISEALTSLSLLEIGGLVSSLPGGAYIRK